MVNPEIINGKSYGAYVPNGINTLHFNLNYSGMKPETFYNPASKELTIGIKYAASPIDIESQCISERKIIIPKSCKKIIFKENALIRLRC